jgi:methyl-accepting chemotaxis protein
LLGTSSIAEAGSAVHRRQLLSAASNEQSQGIERINKAVAWMDEVVQHKAANAEESAAASEEMNARAAQMKGFSSGVIQTLHFVQGA